MTYVSYSMMSLTMQNHDSVPLHPKICQYDGLLLQSLIQIQSYHCSLHGILSSQLAVLLPFQESEFFLETDYTFSSLADLVEFYYGNPLPNHGSLLLQKPYGYTPPR